MANTTKILVTGASGLLGATLCYQWGKNQTLEVLGIYNVNEILPVGFDVFQLDLSDSERLSGLIETFHPDWIVHCAAKTDLNWCESNPMLALKTNVEDSAHLSAIASRCGIRVIYISTDSVFSGEKCWYNESDIVGPVNHYARTKFMAEAAFCLSKDIIVRCNFYGWNLPGQHKGLFQFFYDQLHSGEYVEGWQNIHFSPLSTFQMADVLLNMMQQGWDGGLYHLGSLWGGSKYEFALELCETFALIPRVRRIPYVQSGLVHRPMDTTLNTAKLASRQGGYYLFLGDGLDGLKKFRDIDLLQFRSMVR